MNIDLISKTISSIAPEGSLKNAFLFGSRVWGTSSPLADWDFFLVVENYHGKVHPDINVSIDVEGGAQKVDFSIFSYEIWRKLVASHDMLSLICEFLPTEHKWMYQCPTDVRISNKRMVRAVAKEVNKCLSMSNVHFHNNNDLKTSFKNFVHAIRYLEFGVQIVKFGRIIDFGAANGSYSNNVSLISDPSTDWKILNSYFKPIIVSKENILKQLVESSITNELKSFSKFSTQVSSEDAAPYQILCNYLNSSNAKNIMDIKKYFGIPLWRKKTNESSEENFWILSDDVDVISEFPCSILAGTTVLKQNRSSHHIECAAFGHGRIEKFSIDSTNSQPPSWVDLIHQDLSSSTGIPIFEWTESSTLLTIWYEKSQHSWLAVLDSFDRHQRFCDESTEIIEIEEQFMDLFRELKLDQALMNGQNHGNNVSFNFQFDLKANQIFFISSFDITTQEYSFNLSTQLANKEIELQALVPAETVENPSKNLWNRLKFHCVHSESHPNLIKGYLYVGKFNSLFMESRSYYALQDIMNPPYDKIVSIPSTISTIAHCTCDIFKNESWREKILKEILQNSGNPIKEEYSSSKGKVLFASSNLWSDFLNEFERIDLIIQGIESLWNLVSRFASDARTFNEQIKKAKFKENMKSFMNALRFHLQQQNEVEDMDEKHFNKDSNGNSGKSIIQKASSSDKNGCANAPIRMFLKSSNFKTFAHTMTVFEQIEKVNKIIQDAKTK